jgi:4-aminobutyrate aminotransferase-like enzyme/Ser/Thr protein kinase RdoA (MazF antagonist)
MDLPVSLNTPGTAQVSVPDAVRLAAEHFGLAGTAVPLPGEYDANFHFAASGAEFALKVMHPARDREFIELQAAALEHIAARDPDLLLPRLRRTTSGERCAIARLAEGEARVVWMLGWMSGRPLAEIRPRYGTALNDLGRLLGRMDAALADFTHPAARRQLKWDLTRAGWIRQHLERIADAGRRGLVERFLALYDATVVPVLPDLRRSVIHGDANDYNVLVETPRGRPPRTVSVIDLGDMHHGATVCEPAVAAAYALLDAPDPLAAAARVVAGYHAAVPLTDMELAVLFPLICARLCVSVVNSADHGSAAGDDPYATISERPAWAALERLAGIPSRLAQYTFRAACGLAPVPHGPRVEAWLAKQRGSAAALLGMDARTARSLVFDLSVGSLDLGADPSRLETPALTEHLRARMREAGAEIGIGRYDEARAVYAGPAFAVGPLPTDERRTIHLGLDLFAAPATVVCAPLSGTVLALANNRAALDYGPVVVLRHATGDGIPFFTLYGHLSADSLARLTVGDAITKGDRIGTLGVADENGGWPPHLHFQVITDLLELGTDFPGVALASARACWRSLSPDPGPLLGIAGARAEAPDPAAMMARRRALIGGNVSLSYQEPVATVRGWRQYLYDDTARAFLDVYNNVPLVGHSHPRVVAAVRRQLALLNTNTRYLHDNLLRYAEQLTARLPAPLRVCFVLNSASEANELALRLARAHTKRRDVIVLEHAYHGNTTTLIDISPYKFDGPGGGGRQPWVHVAPIADDYRGAYRRDDPGRGHRYAAHVADILVSLSESGELVGAFIAESLPSVGGQIVFPAGYLADVYRSVREAGGVCIADEVQVGFGRLGSAFWGFQTQEVTPDIVVLGKPIGNGFPLAAVVTSPEIAASFDAGMEFFSTFGGNPVACAAGLATLEVLDDERLMENAREVGDHLKGRLANLGERHALVGDVRGLGLFLGVELVRDRESLEPADDEASYVVNRLRQNGVLCGTDGPHHNVLKIRPPLCFTSENADLLVAGLDDILGEDPVRPPRP